MNPKSGSFTVNL